MDQGNEPAAPYQAVLIEQADTLIIGVHVPLTGKFDAAGRTAARHVFELLLDVRTKMGAGS